MEHVGDESRLHRRKSFKSLLFGKLTFGHKFRSSPDGCLDEKENLNKVLIKCSSNEGESSEHNSEETTSQVLNLRKCRKNSLGRSLSWMKWNFLSTIITPNHSNSTSSQHSCCPFIPKHEDLSSVGSKSPSVETDRYFQQQNSDDGFSPLVWKNLLNQRTVGNSSKTGDFEKVNKCLEAIAFPDDVFAEEHDELKEHGHIGFHVGEANSGELCCKDYKEEQDGEEGFAHMGLHSEKVNCNEQNGRVGDEEGFACIGLHGGEFISYEQCGEDDEEKQDDKEVYVHTSLHAGKVNWGEQNCQYNEEEQGHEQGFADIGLHAKKSNCDEQCSEEQEEEEGFACTDLYAGKGKSKEQSDRDDEEEQDDEQGFEPTGLPTRESHCDEHGSQNDEEEKEDEEGGVCIGLYSRKYNCDEDDDEEQDDKFNCGEQKGKYDKEQQDDEVGFVSIGLHGEANCDKQCSEEKDEGEEEESSVHVGLHDGESNCTDESCEDDEEEHDGEEGFSPNARDAQFDEEHVQSRRRESRQFPPPLPSLARTGNLPCHSPWVLLRSYKTDGRLVIQEVKLRHHEFFWTERSNGCLTMQLVQHDEEKVRAHQAGMFSAKANRIRPGAQDADRVDDNNNTKDGEIEFEEDDQDHVTEVAAVNVVTEDKAGGDTEGLTNEAPNTCFSSFSRGETMPSGSVQMQMQCFSPRMFVGTSNSHARGNYSGIGIGSKGVESPASLCAPSPNSFFQIPLPTINPILS